MTAARKALTCLGVVFGATVLLSGAKAITDVVLYHEVELPAQMYPSSRVVEIKVDGAVRLSTTPASGDGERGIEVSMRAYGGMAMPKPAVTTTDSLLTVSGRCPITWFASGDCGVDVTLTVPEGTAVTVDSTSGDVDTTGRLSALNVSLGSGAITVTDAGAGVDLSTSSGDITVSGVSQPISARTGSGAIVVDGGGDVQASTSSGDVTIDATGTVTASTGSGAVRVDGAGDAVTAKASSGDVTVTGVRGQSVGPVTATSGSGAVVVTGFSGDATARTSSGDVTVEAGGNVDASTGSGAVVVYAWEASRPVVLQIATGSGNVTTQAATDPNASISVKINSSSGDVTYASPR